MGFVEKSKRKKIQKMLSRRVFSLIDLPYNDGMYYVGNVVDVDGSPWVEEKVAREIITLINNELEQNKKIK